MSTLERAPIDLDGRLTLTADEASQVLGIHHSTLRRHHAKMGIPTIRLAGRMLFPVAGLREWVASRSEVAA